MDKKKKISALTALFITALFTFPQIVHAQVVDTIQFCDKHYDYAIGKDSITLFIKPLDKNGNRLTNIDAPDLINHLDLFENDELIPKDHWTVKTLTEGQRIPDNFTISVLVDQTIPEEGKESIYHAIERLLESTHENSVYLSFFGDVVTSSQPINRKNIADFKDKFKQEATQAYIYSALYAKLSEFNWLNPPDRDSIKKEAGYVTNNEINSRAVKSEETSEGENLLFLFTESHDEYSTPIEYIDYPRLQKYLSNAEYAKITPKVYAFFYDTGNGIDVVFEHFLKGITEPRDVNHNIIKKRKGAYMSSTDMGEVIENFEQAIRNEMYDFALSYQVPLRNSYSGNKVKYEAIWDDKPAGSSVISIGTPERPWPIRQKKAGDSIAKYLIALLVSLLTVILFITVMEILIPGIKSLVFSARYYKPYKPRGDVTKLTCPYCRIEIEPGEPVVTKCQHLTHVKCWKTNGKKCAEYGQNCKEGIQDYVHWEELFTKRTLRDSYLTIMGIAASLVSWIIYELSGGGLFNGLATGIVNTFLRVNESNIGNVGPCIAKVSSFLTIGMLLAFFLSFIFRYYDDVKKKDWRSLLKITELSLLSSIIGMASFVLGAIILCVWLSPTEADIPWYCSFPAYLLFSVCMALSLTIKSSIPVKSALLGGLFSAILGFFVLYFSNITSRRWSWMSMLLDFVIYGGGLGASLVTVRMMAEKYFLVIMNGVRNGLRIPIHKWMNATGGGNIVTIGMTPRCEIMMDWEKSNKVAKEHVQLYVDHDRSQAMMRPLANTVYNTRAMLGSNSRPVPLSNGDTFQVGDTIFRYVEN